MDWHRVVVPASLSMVQVGSFREGSGAAGWSHAAKA